MAEARISGLYLAENTGVPVTTINRIRNKGKTNPTLETLLPIARFFNLTISQLVGENDLVSQKEVNPTPSTNAFFLEIPIISWESAHSWVAGKMCPVKEYAISNNVICKGAYGLVVQNEYWQDFKVGTLLIIKPSLKAEDGDYIVVHELLENETHENTLRKLSFESGKKYLLPMTSGGNTEEMTDRHFLLGVLAEYQKKLKW